MAKIKEDEIENEIDLEVGGLQRLDIANITKPLKYEVKSYEIQETDYGKRVDFTICDDYAEWILSSWNIISKKRFKPVEIIGKTITLEPYNEKKCKVSF